VARRRTPVPLDANSRAARSLALALMAEHGLFGWSFAFNNRKRGLGLCRYEPKVIELSRYYAARNPIEHIRDTILHEIAHALVGPGHGHDAVWRAKCLEVGAVPVRCGTADMPAGRWHATCGGCGSNFQRHRKPRRLTGWYCRDCGVFKGQFIWRLRTS
jgi:predicted SprT family Zn-dependent metalloprotease